MFHVMLILIPLIFLSIVASFILFGISAVVLSIFGGTAALMIKNKTAKYLLVVSFLILFLIGVQCLFPFAGAYLSMDLGLIPMISTSLYGLIALLSLGAIKISTTVSNKNGRIALIILFGFFAAIALVLAVFMFSVR